MQATCPRCRHDSADIRYDYGREKIVLCRGCKLLFLDPLPLPSELAEVYGDSYFENVGFFDGDNSQLFGYSDYIAERLNKQPQYAEIAREIRSLVVPMDHEPHLLEVGCGFGYFLPEAFEEGFSVSGLEFNKQAVDRLRRKYAFKIHAGALEEAHFEPETFDAVAMFDVIEHFRDPFVALDILHRSMTPGGLLAVSTPDAGSLVSRMLGSRLEDFRRTREHLFFFTRETMTETLEEHGFDVISIRSIGHTFGLAFLLDRLALYNKPIFGTLRRMVEAIGLANVQLKINPGTKMIVLARRRSAPVQKIRSRERSDNKSIAPVDQVLMDELETLETATPSHYKWVSDIITPHLGRSILEVGSGTGVISKFLVPHCDSLILSDHNPAYLSPLRERFGDLSHVRFQILDLNDRPYRCEGPQPDTIVCLNVLEHIEDHEAVLRSFAEILPSGGRVILQVPNYPRLFGSLDEVYGHYRRYNARTLRELLDRTGFDTIKLRRFNPASIPGWVVTNNLLRSSRLNPGSLNAYEKLVPLLRKLDFVSYAAGLSLIVCARKR
jgi:SAM-dependent methyltransferase